jgi:molybdate transport system substrate-binding protein
VSSLIALFFVNLGRRLAVFTLAALAGAGLSPAASLTVAAAADLASAERDLTDGFHRAFPVDSARFVFGASGALAQQIGNGAPYDLFLSANEAFVDQLALTGKILPDSVKVYAQGQVGMLWRDGKSHKVSELEDKAVRFIAIANPKLAPYGLAAQQSLEHEGLWDSLRTKVVFGENVRQALQMFDSGNADVVLTAYSLIADRPGVTVIPAQWHRPIRQKVGIVAASANAETARHFIAFLGSRSGAAILRQHGLEPGS